MRATLATAACCFVALGCGDGEVVRQVEANAGHTSDAEGLPNACELFSETHTQAYGGLGEGQRTTSEVADACIYTAEVEGGVRQISVLVGVSEAFVHSVLALDTLYGGSARAPVNYGDEAYLYIDDGRGALVALVAAYYVQVDVRLPEPESALRAVVEVVLAQL